MPSAGQTEPVAHRIKAASPLVLVLYITLHLLWLQFLPDAVYAILPLSFVTFFVLLRMAHGRAEGTVEQVVGRWLPRRSDLPVAVAFLVCAAILRALMDRCFGIVAAPRKFAVITELAVLAPVSEELVCRGIFLGILLARLPRQPSMAVMWSAAIFLGLHHSIPGVDVVGVAGVFLLGLLCGAAYATTRCVPLCVGCHMIFNGLQWWTATGSYRVLGVLDIFMGLLFFLVGALVTAWLLRVFIRRMNHPNNPQIDPN